MVAPIMLPFGFAWLFLGFCLSAYHSYLVLDEEQGEVAYHISLLFHSWANRVRRGQVLQVVVEPVTSKFRFLIKVTEGDDLTVTTSDYWHCREWAEQVATFLNVTLVDECRRHEELSPEDLSETVFGRRLVETFPEPVPTNIRVKRGGASHATLDLPARGIGRSQWPRVVAGALLLVTGALLYPGWGWYALGPALAGGLWAFLRPLARATHREEITASPNGLLATVTMLGRSRRTSLDSRTIRSISVVKGEDARFEHTDFDRHAVCIESTRGHLQLGANLAKMEQVEWLCQALSFLLTQPPGDGKKTG